MKKIALLSALLFVCFATPSFADEPKISSFQINGYTVSLEETKGTVHVQVQNVAPYGYSVRYGQSGKKELNGKPVFYLKVVFDTPPELDLKTPLKASEPYGMRIAKGSLEDIILTVKTGSITNVAQQVIWQRSDDTSDPTQ